MGTDATPSIAPPRRSRWLVGLLAANAVLLLAVVVVLSLVARGAFWAADGIEAEYRQGKAAVRDAAAPLAELKPAADSAKQALRQAAADPRVREAAGDLKDQAQDGARRKIAGWLERRKP